MFINLSNHPSAKWSLVQANAAKNVSHDVVDLPFPNVPPMATDQEVAALAASFVAKVAVHALPVTVHLMGETSFVAAFIRLAPTEWSLVCSTTERRSIENPDGSKNVSFEFCQFRSLR